METVIWNGEDLGQYTKEQLIEFTRGITVNVPFVMENNEIIGMQPWNHENELQWDSEEDALAWGANYIVAVEDSRNAVPPEQVSTESATQAFTVPQDIKDRLKAKLEAGEQLTPEEIFLLTR